MPRVLALVITPLISTLSACSSATADAPVEAAEARVLAVGDLHGDKRQAQKALMLAGVVDAEGHWAAGTATFVQTGDVTDRGADSKALMDWMDQLGSEAKAAGGQVRSLVGNHEAMNLLGDWRYVHPDDVTQFGGLEARKAAFGPGGAYAAWVQGRDVVTQVEGTVFCHGGITPEFAAKGIDGINSAARTAFEQRDPEAEVLGSEGPMWDRTLVQQAEEEACPRLAKSLELLGATRMVVGHTTRKNGKIQTRCEGRLAIIDIGIAGHYGGHPGAWELSGNDARALYPTGPVDLPDPPT